MTLHKREEIAGTSVNVGTEAREGGVGVKNESKGSSGLEGDGVTVGSEKEEKEEGYEEAEKGEEEKEHEEEQEESEGQLEEETQEEEHEGREKDKKEKGP